MWGFGLFYTHAALATKISCPIGLGSNLGIDFSSHFILNWIFHLNSQTAKQNGCSIKVFLNCLISFAFTSFILLRHLSRYFCIVNFHRKSVEAGKPFTEFIKHHHHQGLATAVYKHILSSCTATYRLVFTKYSSIYHDWNLQQTIENSWESIFQVTSYSVYHKKYPWPAVVLNLCQASLN